MVFILSFDCLIVKYHLTQNKDILKVERTKLQFQCKSIYNLNVDQSLLKKPD